jgi:hypothetical protein
MKASLKASGREYLLNRDWLLRIPWRAWDRNHSLVAQDWSYGALH